MTTSRIARWGFGLSVAVLALAVLLRVRSKSQTFCYQGVRTQDEAKPSANCFTVSAGVFTNVFAYEKAGDAGAGYAIPGLWDGHGHLMQYGEFLHSVDLFGSSSLEDVRNRIADYLEAHPGTGRRKEWVRGFGWDQMAYGRMPTAADLEADSRLKGRFIMLDRVDAHCIWVSQAVLNLLPKNIPDVPGGEIIREPSMGVFCDNAVDMVTALWLKPGKELRRQVVKAAMAKLNEVGLVGIHDARTMPSELSLYSEMAGTDDWTVRVYAMGECKQRNTFCPDTIRKIDRDDGMLTVRSVKLFADGALGSWGSAMIEPYADHSWTSGSLLVNSTTLTDLTKSWTGAGFQVNIHAIGDLANRYAIDAIEAALRRTCRGISLAECQAFQRMRIEHAQIIHPDDQERMRSMGIIPSIQPTHATSDMSYAEDRLGPERTRTEAYRMRSLWDLKPVLGSDFPVEPANPFQGIFAAVTRRSPHTGLGVGDSKEGWHPEEALSLDQALEGFTKGPAYGAFLEGRSGVIKEGAMADWVVLDKPLEGMDIDDLRSLKVRETWVGGRRVYHRQ